MKCVALSVALLVAAMGSAYAETLKIAVVPVPHAEILEFLKPELAKEGVTLDVKVFSDYIQPDRQTDEGLLDANYFHSKPYYEAYKKDRPSSDQVPIVAVHIEPFGAYSKKIKSISELKDGHHRHPQRPDQLRSCVAADRQTRPDHAQGSRQHHGDAPGHRQQPQASEIPGTGSGDAAARA